MKKEILCNYEFKAENNVSLEELLELKEFYIDPVHNTLIAKETVDNYFNEAVERLGDTNSLYDELGHTVHRLHHFFKEEEVRFIANDTLYIDNLIDEISVIIKANDLFKVIQYTNYD